MDLRLVSHKLGHYKLRRSGKCWKHWIFNGLHISLELSKKPKLEQYFWDKFDLLQKIMNWTTVILFPSLLSDAFTGHRQKEKMHQRQKVQNFLFCKPWDNLVSHSIISLTPFHPLIYLKIAYALHRPPNGK